MQIYSKSSHTLVTISCILLSWCQRQKFKLRTMKLKTLQKDSNLRHVKSHFTQGFKHRVRPPLLDTDAKKPTNIPEKLAD